MTKTTNLKPDAEGRPTKEALQIYAHMHGLQRVSKKHYGNKDLSFIDDVLDSVYHAGVRKGVQETEEIYANEA